MLKVKEKWIMKHIEFVAQLQEKMKQTDSENRSRKRRKQSDIKQKDLRTELAELYKELYAS